MLTNRSYFVLFCLLALSTLSCSDANPFGELTDIEAAKNRWDEKEITDYRMEVERYCFCPPPMRITAIVKDNEVVEIIDKETGESMEGSAGYATIDDLFSWLENISDKDPQKLELEFHPTLGYPTSIDYNQSDLIADEEMLLKINDLKALYLRDH